MMKSKKLPELAMQVPQCPEHAEPEAEVEPGELPATLVTPQEISSTMAGNSKRRRILILTSDGDHSFARTRPVSENAVDSAAAIPVTPSASSSAMVVPVTPAEQEQAYGLIATRVPVTPAADATELFEQSPVRVEASSDSDAPQAVFPVAEGQKRRRTLLLVPSQPPTEVGAEACEKTQTDTCVKGSFRPECHTWDADQRVRLFARFRELFLSGVRSEPSLLEHRCQKLRSAAKAGASLGIIIISEEEAEHVINEAIKVHTAQAEEAAASSSSASLSAGEVEVVAEDAVPVTDARLPHRTLLPPRGVLRSAPPSRRPPQSREAHAKTLTVPAVLKPDLVKVKSWKELGEQAWIPDAGARASCDVCGDEVTLIEGRLHGGSEGSMFSRDTFSCIECLRKQSFTEADLEKLLRVGEPPRDERKARARQEPPLPVCEDCNNPVLRSEVRHWDDKNRRRHTYCKDCWEWWDERQRGR